jgi:hypothetical protein
MLEKQTLTELAKGFVEQRCLLKPKNPKHISICWLELKVWTNFQKSLSFSPHKYQLQR